MRDNAVVSRNYGESKRGLIIFLVARARIMLSHVMSHAQHPVPTSVPLEKSSSPVLRIGGVPGADHYHCPFAAADVGRDVAAVAAHFPGDRRNDRCRSYLRTRGAQHVRPRAALGGGGDGGEKWARQAPRFREGRR